MAATVNLRLTPDATMALRVNPLVGQPVHTALAEPATQYDLPGTTRGKLLIDTQSNWAVGRVDYLLRGLYALPEALFRLVQPGLKLHVGVQPTQFGETSNYMQGPDTITLSRHMSPEENTPLVIDRIFEAMWANITNPTSTEADAKRDFLGQMARMRQTDRPCFDRMVGPHAQIDPIAEVSVANELVIQLGTRTERLIRQAMADQPRLLEGLERLYKRGLESYVGMVTDQYTGITARELTQVIREAGELETQTGMEGAGNRILFQFIHPRTASRPAVFQTLFKQLMVTSKTSVISTMLTDELRAAVQGDMDALDVNVTKDPEHEAVMAHFADIRAWVRNQVLANDHLLGRIGDTGVSLVTT